MYARAVPAPTISEGSSGPSAQKTPSKLSFQPTDVFNNAQTRPSGKRSTATVPVAAKCASSGGSGTWEPADSIFCGRSHARTESHPAQLTLEHPHRDPIDGEGRAAVGGRA